MFERLNINFLTVLKGQAKNVYQYMQSKPDLNLPTITLSKAYLLIRYSETKGYFTLNINYVTHSDIRYWFEFLVLTIQKTVKSLDEILLFY